MIVSATACTGSNKGDNVESSAEIVNSTVSNDESSQAESNKDDSKMFASIQEYLEYPNTKKSIETMKSTLSTTLYDFDCYADGDALIYEYKFTKQISDDKLENPTFISLTVSFNLSDAVRFSSISTRIVTASD